MTTMMQAFRYHQFGGPEVLQLEQVPRPAPKENEVLVRIHAAGVLPIDWKSRQGWIPIPARFPVIPGSAFAGTIEETGADVTEFEVGQKVFGRSSNGTYASYTNVPEDSIALLPQSMSFDEAATISGGATTAWQVLFHDVGLKAGDSVLIHGAAGGVGLFAVQFAKWKGAHVTATAGPANMDFVRSLGADTVLDYTSTRFEEAVHDLDLVLDTVGGETFERSWSVVKPGGALVSLAGQLPSERNQEKDVKLMKPSRLSSKKDLEEIARLMEEGLVRGVVGRRFSLSEAAQAHEFSQRGHGRGRIVLQVAD